MISIATARKSASQPLYLPLTRHFSSRASSASATERGIPTITSALLVRRLKRGNEPASGPGTERMCSRVSTRPPVSVRRLSGGACLWRFRTAYRQAIGCHQSICATFSLCICYGWPSMRRTCDSYEKGEQAFSAVTTSRMVLCAHFRSPCVTEKYRRQPQNLAIPAVVHVPTLKITSPLSRSASHTFGACRCMSQ